MGLDELFDPDSIAIFCDSKARIDYGRLLVSNIQQGGYTGKTLVVDSHATEICDITCIRDPRDFQQKINLSLLACPFDEMERQVDRAIMAGSKNIVIIPNIPDEKEDLTESIIGICRSRAVGLIGPASLGVVNLSLHLNASCIRSLPRPGSVTFLSESNSVALAAIERFKQENIGISKFVSLGQKTDLDEIALFKYLAADKDTQLVVACLESIASGDAFLKRAESLANVKPLLVFKAGTTSAGHRAAIAHSGHVSANMAYGAAFRRAGIVNVPDFESLVDLTKAFAGQNRFGSDGVSVLSDDGGLGILVADAIEQSALSLSEFSTIDQGQELMDFGPLDLALSSSPEAIVAATKTAIDDEQTGSLILALSPDLDRSNQRLTQVAKALASMKLLTKPFVVVLLGDQDDVRRIFAQNSIPSYSCPARAVLALEAIRTYSLWRAKPIRIVTRFRVNRRRVERILRRHERSGYQWVQDHMARQVLASYDFQVPQSQLVNDVDSAVEVAERMGYPVTLSVVSFQVLDTQSIGAIRSGLTNSAAVRDAYDLIMLQLSRQAPDALLEGVLVERDIQLRHGVVIGMVRDMQFGPLLMFGHGTTGTHIMQNATFHLAPITATEAREMLLGTSTWNQLQERWISMDSDYALDAVVGGLQKISQLATDFPKIQELEINPFSFDFTGTTPIAVHARIVLTRGQSDDNHA